ncbi:MAG: hypothetical protein M9915_00800 [Rhizobacter sp.]|nr:hypothetical protein [Rhizobacter sp.]
MAQARAFAGNAVVRDKREEPSRQAVPAGGDLWSDEDRRTGVGARSALRELTRRNCLSATNAVSEASSATRPLAENRSAVGAVRRPRNHEPPAGTAWRDAKALESKAGIARCNTKALEPLPGTARRDAKAQNPPAVAARRDAQAQALVIRGRSRSAFEAHEQAFPQQDFMRRVARETWRSN